MDIFSKRFLSWTKLTTVRLWENDTTTPKNERVLAHTVKLSEEMGELSEQILATLGHQRKSKISANGHKELADEAADVFIVTMLIANDLGIDMEAAVNSKVKKINDRYKNKDLS